MAKHTANRTRNMYPPVYAKVVETMLLDAMMFNNNNNATTYTVYEEKKSAGKAFNFDPNWKKFFSCLLSRFNSLSLLNATRQGRERHLLIQITHTHTHTHKKES